MGFRNRLMNRQILPFLFLFPSPSAMTVGNHLSLNNMDDYYLPEKIDFRVPHMLIKLGQLGYSRSIFNWSRADETLADYQLKTNITRKVSVRDCKGLLNAQLYLMPYSDTCKLNPDACCSAAGNWVAWRHFNSAGWNVRLEAAYFIFQFRTKITCPAKEIIGQVQKDMDIKVENLSR